MYTGLAFLEGTCKPCDVTVKRMVPLESSNWMAMTWNCCHCFMDDSSTWYVGALCVATPGGHSYSKGPVWMDGLYASLPTPTPLPTYSPIPSTYPHILPTLLLHWPDINAHLIKSPENSTASSVFKLIIF